MVVTTANGRIMVPENSRGIPEASKTVGATILAMCAGIKPLSITIWVTVGQLLWY